MCIRYDRVFNMCITHKEEVNPRVQSFAPRNEETRMQMPRVVLQCGTLGAFSLGDAIENHHKAPKVCGGFWYSRTKQAYSTMHTGTHCMVHITGSPLSDSPCRHAEAQ